MKYLILLIIVAPFIISCNNSRTPKDPAPVVKPMPEPAETAMNFPVTEYLKGQITEIRNKGINPQLINLLNNKSDTSWIKMEQLDSAFEPFLKPVIDSTVTAALFIEKKFLDQTINAITLTYDPLKQLPDSFLFQRWDVYIDPETDAVKRIYLIKQTADHKTIQLTWNAGKNCRMVTLADDSTGKTIVEKEVILNWDL